METKSLKAGGGSSIVDQVDRERAARARGAWSLWAWLEEVGKRGRFAEVIVCDEEFSKIWQMVDPGARQSGYVLLNGMRISPKERIGTLDVSDGPLIPVEGT